MTALVALDWGSSQLRAWRFDAEGRIAGQRHGADGASRLTGGAPAFEAALRALAGDWLAPGVPVLACGMVGSAHGWREAAYRPCPLDLDTLHTQLVSAHGHDGLVLHIVPGASTHGAGAPDVMRGEETQLAGLLQAEAALPPRVQVVMPGTHTKWALLEGGRLAGFATRMTGELYALLREHSVLARLMDTPAPALDTAAFDDGVAGARATGGADLARLLFGVRARGLFGELPRAAAADHLSGLLIGAEVAAALAADDVPGPRLIVGERPLAERYARALAAWGVPARHVDAPLAALGLWRTACAAGLTARCG